jgi:hypothetical protein
MTDFTLIGEGPMTSVYLLRPNSPEAEQWIEEHIPDDAPTMGNAIAVEHRFIADIVEGIEGDGLTVGIDGMARHPIVTVAEDAERPRPRAGRVADPDLLPKENIVIDTLTFDEFAKRYCDRQEQTPDGLREILTTQKSRFHPEGWMLLECADMSSSRLGNLVILPYGGSATFKEIPKRPISPRGLASDMSVVVAILPVDNL